MQSVSLILNGIDVAPELLEKALTHRSYAHEHKGVPDNERLEFLGDSVVGLACSEYLYKTHPKRAEGELTLQRANVVSTSALAERARALGLGQFLRLGNGEEKSGGRDRDSILADAYEALVGAIYLSAGWEVAKRFFTAPLDKVDGKNLKDSKTELQELLQAGSGEAPVYDLAETSGPDHAKAFLVSVLHQGRVLAVGRGRSKKEAEQAAAAAALDQMR